MNPELKIMDGHTLGLEYRSHFGNWSRHGINMVSDVWDEGRKWFRDVEEMRAKTHSRNVADMRAEVISAIPRK